MRNTGDHRYSLLILCLLGAACQPAAAAEGSDAISSTAELLPLSWEELTELDVSGLARRQQSVKDSPAAAFVITSEDIRRSGANSLPDLLRMVPGMNVAKINASNWAVSARGFNDLYANKLQVMIDGRSVYDPLISGVYWGQQNPALQDIERIEVLRGPSGTLWGANAVNGTVNIVTRSARDTQGGLVYGGGGTEERGFGGVRYGGQLTEGVHWRGTLNAVNRDASARLNGAGDTADYTNAQNANFRLDGQTGERDQWMLEANVARYRLQGDYIGVTSVDPPTWRSDDFGRDGVTGSLQGDWRHRTDSGHDWRLNMAFTQTEWTLAMNRMSRSQYVLDWQDSLPSVGAHHWLWGLNYQMISDRFDNTLTLSFLPAEFTQHNVGLFLQDQIDLGEDVKLTLANRIEHFTYTGWETEPNARLIWTPDRRHSLWAAISRAVVLPNRAQHSIRLYKTVPGTDRFFEATANPRMRTENLMAYELGWRWQATDTVDIDTALFYNIYDRMQGTRFTGQVFNDPIPGTLEATVGNERQVKSYGLEVSANYRVNHDWRLQASYSANRFDIEYDRSQSWLRDPLTERHFNPSHQLSLRSLFNLTSEIELDAWARYVDRLYVDQREIPDYITLDLRLGWHPHRNLEFSVSGQNLLDAYHPEFSDILYIQSVSQLQRGYFAQVSWRF